ncbi:unnamed protein product [Clonostachys rosea f. rosea IK726]|uniref:Uncharacterized protein n=8 Tax=Clonostachys rosea f. rosea IK726 TaxID=1349383 RepID=A0ACA9UK13_BIOOC|nr:unnamed protein product [Clonostachys rosea f. rosea IK726]CAG9951844.1 unnamed protein product [Clonostachys rosea f. rosea IK726]CAG9951866.1 unnamed protein product [Clonostachys rosea f. rosea IK726]CAG9953710.1 unnamed protein product [Clonostachys rosea f. rosea IK726]CAG9955493.1 unnamed protein product [Clonostachys rosea f. rosea IK726]
MQEITPIQARTVDYIRGVIDFWDQYHSTETPCYRPDGTPVPTVESQNDWLVGDKLVFLDLLDIHSAIKSEMEHGFIKAKTSNPKIWYLVSENSLGIEIIGDRDRYLWEQRVLIGILEEEIESGLSKSGGTREEIILRCEEIHEVSRILDVRKLVLDMIKELPLPACP